MISCVAVKEAPRVVDRNVGKRRHGVAAPELARRLHHDEELLAVSLAQDTSSYVGADQSYVPSIRMVGHRYFVARVNQTSDLKMATISTDKRSTKRSSVTTSTNADMPLAL